MSPKLDGGISFVSFLAQFTIAPLSTNGMMPNNWLDLEALWIRTTHKPAGL